MEKIGIIGAGAWGTALAQCLANAEHSVLMWAREPNVVDQINNENENSTFLPGVKLNQAIKATGSISKTVDCDTILLVTPAQYVRTTLESLKADIAEGKPIVICSKGIELSTGQLLTEVAQEEVPNATIAILTGPTFASDVARDKPCAVTVGAQDKDVAQEICEGLASRNLRPYITDDLIGVQIGGAVKNVIAIAAGIIEGQQLGESARAALITRGLAEMARLTSSMGGQKETLMGMCGIGDLMLTCNSMESRNFSFGAELGKGKSMNEILLERNSVTEGVHTADALMTMAKNHAIDMPISEAVFKCLHEELPVREAIDQMLGRPLKPENI
jgi:glycerol-3-phosphate dehydrogenase (NAD(P)+)